MSPRAEIVLRDVHDVPVPSLWPLAPGWWAMLALLAAIGLALALWRWQKHRRLQRANALFDHALAQATTPAQRLQAMSDLLRRAARRQRADADTLTGEAWLSFLDVGLTDQPFTTAGGALIESGLYTPKLTAESVAELEVVARQRFVSWMSAR